MFSILRPASAQRYQWTGDSSRPLLGRDCPFFDGGNAIPATRLFLIVAIVIWVITLIPLWQGDGGVEPDGGEPAPPIAGDN